MSVRKRDFSSFKGEVSRRDGYTKSPTSSLAAGSSPPIDHAGRFPSATLTRQRKKPVFSSYLDLPDLSLKIKQLCQIVANTPTSRVEPALDESGHMVTHEDAEEVLKLSYGFPGAAVKFFRWAGRQLDNRHSPYAWNLIVDILGKNRLFDAMWDSVKTMRREGISSLATFASVFSSYVLADRVNEAIKTFEVLDQYGVLQDVMSLNSLLSAICRDGQTSEADEFLKKVMDRIRPDADSYAILLEGRENEGNVIKARTTFRAMISQIGWDPFNVPAYDSFLTLLVKDSLINEAVGLLNVMRNNNCSPGLKFFKTALDVLSNKGDLPAALPIWKVMVASRIMPDLAMYNSIIGLLCHSHEMELAFSLFDEMVYHGAYPDSQTYNILFQTLVKNRKVHDAACIFHEMVKNESQLSPRNCEMGIKLFLDESHPDMAINIWKHAVQWNITIRDESANVLVSGLREQSRLPEACKYAEEMLKRGVSLSSKELSRLKHSLSKVQKDKLYEKLEK
ncbi:pentatricopeptide repeat-containing protein At1g77360, mitochondrial-like [Nymphaea colorata]|nr:pentatricopeptide repeat-containing protein At1g77360, mitochondrial-like [Nymphaea colorata]